MADALHIRETTPEDAPALAALHTALYPDRPMTAEGVLARDRQRAPDALAGRWVAEVGGQVVGMGMFHQPTHDYAPGRFRVWVHVAADFRRRGIGAALYARLLERPRCARAARPAGRGPRRSGGRAALPGPPGLCGDLCAFRIPAWTCPPSTSRPTSTSRPASPPGQSRSNRWPSWPAIPIAIASCTTWNGPCSRIRPAWTSTIAARSSSGGARRSRTRSCRSRATSSPWTARTTSASATSGQLDGGSPTLAIGLTAVLPALPAARDRPGAQAARHPLRPGGGLPDDRHRQRGAQPADADAQYPAGLRAPTGLDHL